MQPLNYRIKTPDGRLAPLVGLESYFRSKLVELEIPAGYQLGNSIEFTELHILRNALIQNVRAVPPPQNANGAYVQGHQPAVTPQNRTLYWSNNVYLSIHADDNIVFDHINLASITGGFDATVFKGQIPFFWDITKSYIRIYGHGQPADLDNPPPVNPIKPTAAGRAILLEVAYIPKEYIERLDVPTA